MNCSTSIELNTADLKSALIGFAKLIPKKPSDLGNLKIQVQDRNTIQITGHGTNLWLTLSVPARVTARTNPFVVPLSVLQQQVREAGGTICIRPEPNALEFTDPPLFRSPSTALEEPVREALLQAFSCASQDATRHVIQGVYLDVTTPRNHRIVATDGRQLFSAGLPLPGIKRPVILPAHKIWQWRPITQSNWELRVNGPRSEQPLFSMQGTGWTITGRCVEGNYPNYRQVIPNPKDYKATIAFPEPALAAITRAINWMPGSKSNNATIGVRIGKTVGLLAHESGQDQWIEIGVPFEHREGPALTLFLNRAYLIKALQFGLNQLDVIDPSSPLRFSNAHRFMIVMPLRHQQVSPDQISQGPAFEEFDQAPKSKPKKTTTSESNQLNPDQIAQRTQQVRKALTQVIDSFDDLMAVLNRKR